MSSAYFLLIRRTGSSGESWPQPRGAFGGGDGHVSTPLDHPSGSTEQSPNGGHLILLTTHQQFYDLFRSAVDPRGGSRWRLLTNLPSSLATYWGREMLKRPRGGVVGADCPLLNRRGNGHVFQGYFSRLPGRGGVFGYD